MYSVMPSTVAPCVTPAGTAAWAAVREGEEGEEGGGKEPGGAEAEGEGHGYLDDEKPEGA